MLYHAKYFMSHLCALTFVMLSYSVNREGLHIHGRNVHMGHSNTTMLREWNAPIMLTVQSRTIAASTHGHGPSQCKGFTINFISIHKIFSGKIIPL
jgi:hypothetical protein